MRRSGVRKINRLATVVFYTFFAGRCCLTVSDGAPVPFLSLPNGSTNYSSGLNINGSNVDLSYWLTSLAGVPTSSTDLLRDIWSPVAPTSQWWISETAWANTGPGQEAEYFRVNAKDP